MNGNSWSGIDEKHNSDCETKEDKSQLHEFRFGLTVTYGVGDVLCLRRRSASAHTKPEDILFGWRCCVRVRLWQSLIDKSGFKAGRDHIFIFIWFLYHMTTTTTICANKLLAFPPSHTYIDMFEEGFFQNETSCVMCTSRNINYTGIYYRRISCICCDLCLCVPCWVVRSPMTMMISIHFSNCNHFV